MRDLVMDALEADVTLMALLTGGLYAATEISRQLTPNAFDANAEIEPCGLVALEVETPVGPHDTGSRAYFTVTFYERVGFTTIDAALARAYAVLHRQKIGAATDHVWEVRHADDSAEFQDPALLCSSRYARFWALRLR